MNGEAVKALLKFAEATEYDRYGLPIEQTKRTSPVPATLLGGALGGATAHFALPSEATRGYREMLKKTISEMAKNPKKLFSFKDAPAVGGVLRPAVEFTDVEGDVLKRYLEDRSMASNAPNMFAGIGTGLLGGYLLHKFLSR